MERDEITIDLREMVLYVVRKWKLILLCMVILAVLCDVISFAPNLGAKKDEVAVAKKEIEENSDVQEVDDAFVTYAKYKSQYQNTCDYIKDSVIMELDSAAVATDTIVYSVSSEKAGDIAKALVNFTADSELSAKIASAIGCNEKYAGELINVSNKAGDAYLGSAKIDLSSDSAVVVLTIYSPDKSKFNDISDYVKASFEIYAGSMKSTYGDFGLDCAIEQVGVSASDIVATKQQNVTTSLDSLKTSMSTMGDSFTSEQTAYFEALKKDLNSSEKKEKAVSLINIKFIVLGAAAGCILSAIALAIVYILMRKVKAVSDISESFKVDVIGKPVDCSNQATVKNGVDYICTQLGVLSDKTSNKNIVFASTVETNKLNGVDTALKEIIKDKLSEAEYVGSVISDVAAVKTLEKADGVVLVEKMFETTYDDLESEILLCRRLNIPVIGCVVIK